MKDNNDLFLQNNAKRSQIEIYSNWFLFFFSFQRAEYNYWRFENEREQERKKKPMEVEKEYNLSMEYLTVSSGDVCCIDGILMEWNRMVFSWKRTMPELLPVFKVVQGWIMEIFLWGISPKDIAKNSIILKYFWDIFKTWNEYLLFDIKLSKIYSKIKFMALTGSQVCSSTLCFGRLVSNIIYCQIFFLFFISTLHFISNTLLHLVK